MSWAVLFFYKSFDCVGLIQETMLTAVRVSGDVWAPGLLYIQLLGLLSLVSFVAAALPGMQGEAQHRVQFSGSRIYKPV